jgi:hypothetical protein
MLHMRLACVAAALGLLAVPGSRILSAQPAQVDATLLPVIYDRQDGSHFTRWTALDAAGRSYDLDSTSTSAAALDALPVGASLRLTLVRDGARLSVARWEPGAPTRRAPGPRDGTPFAATAASSPWADTPFSGALPVLVIPCAFSDAGPTSATRAAMERAMNDEFPGVGAFIASASGGLASLAGTRVLDWVTIPERVNEWFVNRTMSIDPTRFSSNLARDEAFAGRCLAEAQRRDPALTAQPYLAIQMMLSVNLGASWAYLAPVPINSVDATRRIRLVMNSDWAATSPGVQAHELGHTLGLRHTFGPYGVEYDSRWDVMSNASQGYDQTSQLRYGTLFNGWHRMRLGWAGADAVANVPLTAMHDTILLGTAASGASAVRAARLELAPIGPGTARVLTLEARRRDEAFEAALPREGVVLHRVTGQTAIVVDRDGNGDPNDDGAVLRPGERWEDDQEGVAIEVLEERPEGFRVAIARRSAFRIVATSSRRLQLGRPYQDSLGVLGGVEPVRLSAEALPPGIRLDTARRMLTGTATQAGPFTIRLRATDATGAETAHEIAALVDPLEAMAGPMVREGRVGEPRVDTLAFYRFGPGFNGRTCIMSNGASGAPRGMRLEVVLARDSVVAALLRGTPTEVVDADYPFGLCADAFVDERSWRLRFRIRPGRLIVAGDSLRSARIEGVPGADTLRLGGGEGAPLPAARWRITAGTLPDGWRLDSLTGIASGVAHAAGTFSATVQAIAPGDSTTALLRWTILSALELGESPWGATLPVGLPRYDTLRVLSRAGAPSWRVRAGALPTGVTLTTDGRLIGAPTTIGAFQVLLEVRAGAATRSLPLTGRVERVPLHATWASADTLIMQGDVLLDSLRLADGDGSVVTVQVSPDSLPPGLSFDPSSRLLFGRPQAIGAWRVPVTVVQGTQRIELSRTLRVTPMASLAEDSLPTATAGFPFTHRIIPVVQGGGTVTVRADGAALPGGLTLSQDGEISGTPDALGNGAASLVLEIVRSETTYEVPVTVRWTVREVALDAVSVFDALLGVRPLDVEPARGFDLLGNRNDRLDVGDVLRWLVRRGVLSPTASVQDVMPALRTMLHKPNGKLSRVSSGTP